MKKLLIVVDMQNDFIDGALKNPAAQKIVQPMCEFIDSWNGDICFTEDTHNTDYLGTPEGLKLPIPHCIKNTYGQEVNNDLIIRAMKTKEDVFFVEKHSFGYDRWDTFRFDEKYDEIVICGTCTDICVVSNALILKALYPNIKITIKKDLCAGLSAHEEALKVMQMCQCDVE